MYWARKAEGYRIFDWVRLRFWKMFLRTLSLACLQDSELYTGINYFKGIKEFISLLLKLSLALNLANFHQEPAQEESSQSIRQQNSNDAITSLAILYGM